MHFSLISFFVEDLGAMVRFYQKMFQLKTDWDGISPYAEFKHQGIRFAFYERSGLPEFLGINPTFPSGINGTFELAVDLNHPDDVNREYHRCVDAGAQSIRPPFDAEWGQRAAVIADPEGNMIEFGAWLKH